VNADVWLYVAIAMGVLSLIVAAFYGRQVLEVSPGNDRMVYLMGVIREGSMTFMKREYTAIAGFVVVMAILIYALLDWGRPWGAVAYVFGAIISALAGFIGMRIATAANARTAEAARQGGTAQALPVAFRGGAVMGFTVAGLGLLGFSLGVWFFGDVLEDPNWVNIVTAIGLGASSIALFARVGGGIYTKAADVGADLVGKVEAGIPEDDPRNPATIADNVGDNVGDVAMIASIGMGASIIGSFLVKPKGDHLAKALATGTLAAAGLTVLGVAALTPLMFNDVDGVKNSWGFFLAVVVGLAIGLLVGKISEWYTSDHYKTVKGIAKQSETGPATVILAGISEGMKSAAYSVIVVAFGMGAAYWAGDLAIDGGGIYGVAIAAIGVLSTLGITVSVDAYGPIADNAGGIAEMANLDPEVREATDQLDALGNTTAAVAKGFAIASAAVTAMALFFTFASAVGVDGFNILDIEVVIGLFLGGMFPFLFAALTIQAVGRAAFQMIEEVRRQFREIPGLREGKEGVEPEYK